ncbi:hypothetical protein [Virgibacillus litoralis]|uniref:Uncharacterized protein n=1 Tax=Virgibacillus litoralis TaxID=578221 RepID=A0ABS4HBV1_9BACI|nr:hypothetical protein [Virgibacillus litoralis]MBP1948343.1 hypothetical protein [Virgibacillus litoralis]
MIGKTLELGENVTEIYGLFLSCGVSEDLVLGQKAVPTFPFRRLI